MMLYGSGWNCSPFWGTVLDIYKTLPCKSLIQKKKKKIPTYLPTSKMMGRSTANIHFLYARLKNGRIMLYPSASAGLEIYTRPLVFTSSLSVRTSENCY